MRRLQLVEYRMEDHYAMVMRWWKEHEWTPVLPQFLPIGRLVREDGGDFICAGWMHKCLNSQTAFLEWVVGKPGSDKKVRDESLDLLFESLIELTEPGTMILGFSEHPNLVKRYEKHGFTKGEDNMTLLWKYKK